jgi:hypothetical protein
MLDGEIQEDPEKGDNVDIDPTELEIVEEEPNTVFWDGPNDTNNPQNWSLSKVSLNITIISLMTFLTPLASSMFAPGVPDVMREFNTDR